MLVQSGATLKLDTATMLAKLPAQAVTVEASEAPASGALSITKAYSKVTPAGAPTAYTLAAGAHGYKKTIVCETVTSGTAVVTVTGGKGFTTLTFNAIGDTIVLQNIDALWYVVGNNSVTVA